MKYILILLLLSSIAHAQTRVEAEKYQASTGGAYVPSLTSTPVYVAGMRSGATLTFDGKTYPVLEGRYKVTIRYSTTQKPKLTISTDTISLPSTNSWSVWNTFTDTLDIKDLNIKLITSESLNFDWFEYTQIDAAIPIPIPPVVSLTIDTIFCTEIAFPNGRLTDYKTVKYLIVTHDPNAVWDAPVDVKDDTGAKVSVLRYKLTLPRNKYKWVSF